MSELLPAIGASGNWKLKAPYDAQYIAGLAYSCRAINKLSAVVTLGLDAKAEYYDKNGLSQEIYDDHVAKDISILTLVSSAGNYIFVPAPYVDGWPTNDAVPYVVMGMLINLGALPNTIDPTFLKTKVENVILANLGHQPEIEFVTLSEVTNKSWDDHTSLENARQSALEDSSTDYVRRVNAEEELLQARAQIQALQQYIIDQGNLPPSG